MLQIVKIGISKYLQLCVESGCSQIQSDINNNLKPLIYSPNQLFFTSVDMHDATRT